MQVINCPVCNGWGTNSLPIKGKFKTCEHCKGESVQLKDDNYMLFWDMPSHFDYGGRERARLVRFIVLGGMAFLVITLILSLIILGNQAIRLI